MLTVTTKMDAVSDSNVLIPRDTKLEYLGHVIGGMISVKYNGNEMVIHPLTTKELSCQTGQEQKEGNGD